MHSPAAPNVAPSDALTYTKVPRERIVRLVVETEICPLVLLRVLGLLAQRGTMPLNIAARRSDDHMSLAIEIEAPSEVGCRSLVAKIAAIAMVRGVAVAPLGVLNDASASEPTDPAGNYLIPRSLGG
jgi:hypothetical protein